MSKEGGIYWKCFSKCFQSEKFCITFPRKNCCGIQVVKNEGRCRGIRKVPSWLAGEINAVQKMCFVLITQHNRVEKEKRMISCCSSNFETKAILCYLLFFFLRVISFRERGNGKLLRVKFEVLRLEGIDLTRVECRTNWWCAFSFNHLVRIFFLDKKSRESNVYLVSKVSFIIVDRDHTRSHKLRKFEKFAINLIFLSTCSYF